jgi:RNA polymerase sigma-70 factor (ECF subfamily)
MSQSDEKVLFENIKKGHLQSFETLFHRYYGYLCSYAEKFTLNHHAAEEIVQEFFVQLWEKREKISIESSVKNYFFRSIKNHCLNYIQHQKIHDKYSKTALQERKSDESHDEVYIETELAAKIEESILSLPEKRREIFRLSREEGLKYSEIAIKLNISIKTVETQMSLAIRSLREKLKEYITSFLFFFIFF